MLDGVDDGNEVADGSSEDVGSEAGLLLLEGDSTGIDGTVGVVGRDGLVGPGGPEGGI